MSVVRKVRSMRADYQLTPRTKTDREYQTYPEYPNIPSVLKHTLSTQIYTQYPNTLSTHTTPSTQTYPCT